MFATLHDPPLVSGYQTTTDAFGHYQFRPQGDVNNWGVRLWGLPNQPMTATYVLQALGQQTQPLSTFSSRATLVNFNVPGAEPHNARCEDGRGAPDHVGFPCSVTTGNVFFDHVDADLPGLRGALALTRSYNSVDNAAGRYGVFGPGWNQAYERRMTDLGGGGLMFRRSDGTVMYYYQDSPGAQTYHATFPPTETSTVVHPAGGTYVRQFREGGSETYDASGRLTAIADRLGPTSTLSYTGGELTSITDAGGRALTLEHEAGRVVRLRGPGGVLLASYEYTDNRLTRVTYPDSDDPGADEDGGYTYIYETAPGPTLGYLTEVHDLEGKVVEKHAYDDQGRGTTSEKADGVERLTLDYQADRTVVTDARAGVTTYEWKLYWGKKRVTRITGPCSACGGGGGDVQEWTYDPKGL